MVEQSVGEVVFARHEACGWIGEVRDGRLDGARMRAVREAADHDAAHLMDDPIVQQASTAELMVAAVGAMLVADPEIRAIAAANDGPLGAERFAEACSQPWFGQKLGRAFAAFREAVTS